MANDTSPQESVTDDLRSRIELAVDAAPLLLRDALHAVLDRIDAECAGASRQIAMGDYRLCPPDMLRVYVHEAIAGALPHAS